MSTTWNELHRRHEVLAHIDANVSTAHERSTQEVFTDLHDLLRAAHQQWITTLGGAIETALELGGGDLLADVRYAWQVARERHPGLRALLDQHADHPAVAPLIRREHALLSRATGMPGAFRLIANADTQQVRTPQRQRSFWLRLFAGGVARA